MGKAGGWLGALGPVIGVVAGVMVVAGVYLLDPAVVDLGFALSADRTWLVGAFLIAMGCALAFKLAWPKGLESGSAIVELSLSFMFGEISHFAYGFIAAGLAAQAVFGEAPNYWVALLAVPALLSLIIAFGVTDRKETVEEQPSEVDEGEDYDADATQPESGQVDLVAALKATLFVGALVAAFIFAGVAWITFIFWFYEALRSVIFEGGTFNQSSASAALLEAMLRALPTVVPLAIVLGAITVGITLIGEVFRWFAQRRAPDANRDLSPAEAAYIDASAQAVTAYAKAQGYDRNVWPVQVFGLVAVLAGIGVGTLGAIHVHTMMQAPPLGPSFPLVLSPGGFAVIGLAVVAICLSALPQSILSRLSRRYSERSGWIAIGEKNDYFTLKGKLTTFVRARRLSTATPINPSAFLHVANLSFEPFFYVPAAVLTVATLFFMHRDLNAADVLTEDAIEVTNYWTLATTRYGYGDVVKVELRCFLTDKNDPVEAYVLHFKDGHSLDIYKSQTVVERLIAAYEAIDAKLVAQGVPFVPGSHQGWFKRDERGYDADCVETLAKEFPEELRPRVKKLFHVDEMTAGAGGRSPVTPP